MKQENRRYTQEELKKIELEKQQEEEREREMILMKADEIKEQTFDFDMDGQLDLKSELDDMMLGAIDDPEAKHALYYKVINRLMRQILPKGDNFKEARDLINEEKNTFLTGGYRIDESGIRGADGRMGYIEDMHEFMNIITEWISSKGTIFELYIKLRDLNVSKGYGTAFDWKR